MKRLTLLAACACALALEPTLADLPLAVRGQPAAYTIVVPAKASPSQRYAAEELRDYAEKATGVKLPVATDAEPLPAKAILLGETRYTAGLAARGAPQTLPGAARGAPQTFPPRPAADIGTDGFRLVARPPHLLVVGSPDRGALYGVYELLERFAGCRWYASWCEKVPRLDRFAVPDALDDTQVPALAMREPFWWDVLEHPQFAARLRANSRSWRSNEEKYGGMPFRFGGGLGSCHTFNKLLPPEKYFDEHPEYFSMVKGKRLNGRTQLCLTNPDVLRIVTSNVLARIRSDPGAKFYGVSQNDWYNYCECPACNAIDDEEESHAGTMVRFVNAIAEAVEKEFPGVLIETLAYQYTRKPPKKTRLRHNVIPCLCTIECDFAQPLDVSPYGQNVSFRDDIRGWAKQTDLLYVWDYVTDFGSYVMPFPNVYALQGNVKFLHANGVKCLFEQGAYQGRHADFAELKAWLLAKWMWNPDLPMEPLLDDFFAGYYGKAAPFVRRYFEAVHRMQLMHSASADNPLRIFDAVTLPSLPDAVLDMASACWKQAIDAVKDDPAASYNVRMGAFSVDFMRLERMRRKTDKVLYLAKTSTAGERLAEAQGLAKSLLDRMAEAKDIRLAENITRHERLVQDWRKLVARPSRPAATAISGEVEENEINTVNKGTWGDYVDDPKASDGKALKLFNSHYEWCSTFHMHRVEFEPGATYKVRVRVRVDKMRDGGEAFWAGVYDPVAKRGRGGIEPRTESVSSDYAWYDVCTWVPNENEFFWIGPGRFGKDGKSSINALWVDKIEFVRVTNVDAQEFRYAMEGPVAELFAECKARGITITDWHLHIRGGMTPEMAVARERASGIRSSAMENHGREWPMSNNAQLAAFAAAARKANPAMPVGLQVNDRDWFRQIDPATRAKFDYILADTMIMGKLPNGRDKRLWLLKDMSEIGDPEKWMDAYMAHNLQILGEPISILANPTYLPAPLAPMYDKLWTDERMKAIISKAVERGIAIEVQAESKFQTDRFLRLAKKMGAKFSFGTNNFDPKPKDLSRWLEAIRLLDLHGDDIWTPACLAQGPRS